MKELKAVLQLQSDTKKMWYYINKKYKLNLNFLSLFQLRVPVEKT